MAFVLVLRGGGAHVDRQMGIRADGATAAAGPGAGCVVVYVSVLFSGLSAIHEPRVDGSRGDDR